MEKLKKLREWFDRNACWIALVMYAIVLLVAALMS